MLDFDKQTFPGIVIDLIHDRLALDSEPAVIRKRRLTTRDSALSIGLFGDTWTPERDTQEMLGRSFGEHETTVNHYILTIQGLVIDTDEERGLAKHYVLANYLRSTLAWDQHLVIGLRGMEASVADGVTEVLQRWKVDNQKYYSADLSGKWAYMSVLRFNLETETRSV